MCNLWLLISFSLISFMSHLTAHTLGFGPARFGACFLHHINWAFVGFSPQIDSEYSLLYFSTRPVTLPCKPHILTNDGAEACFHFNQLLTCWDLDIFSCCIIPVMISFSTQSTLYCCSFWDVVLIYLFEYSEDSSDLKVILLAIVNSNCWIFFPVYFLSADCFFFCLHAFYCWFMWNL